MHLFLPGLVATAGRKGAGRKPVSVPGVGSNVRQGLHAPLRRERLHQRSPLATSVPATAGFAMITNPQISVTCPMEVCVLHKLRVAPTPERRAVFHGVAQGSGRVPAVAPSTKGSLSGCSSRGGAAASPGAPPVSQRLGNVGSMWRFGVQSVLLPQGRPEARRLGPWNCTGHSHSYTVTAALSGGTSTASSLNAPRTRGSGHV